MAHKRKARGDHKQNKKPKQEHDNLSAFCKSTLSLVQDLREGTRSIKTQFLELPSKKLYPDYYTKIKNPISLHEIKKKVNQHAYEDAFAFENDFKLMAENAAEYNLKESVIAMDAQNMYSFVSDQVKQFVGIPEAPKPGKLKLKLKAKKEKVEEPPAEESEEAEEEEDEEEEDEEPASFFKYPVVAATKQKLFKLMDIVSEYRLNDETIADVFFEEPSKKLYPDYYAIIDKPMSINTVIKNLSNKKTPKYPTVQDFINDVNLIWKNAQTYNEPSSLVYQYSEVLQDFFDQQVLKLAKEEGTDVSELEKLAKKKKQPSLLKLKLKHNDKKKKIKGKVKEEAAADTDNEAGVNEAEAIDSEEQLENADGEYADESGTGGISRVKREKDGEHALIKSISMVSTRPKSHVASRPAYGQPNPESQLSNIVFQTWFEYNFEAQDYRIPNCAVCLPVYNTVSNKGAVTILASLAEDLEEQRHEHYLTVNNERVKPSPSVSYADSDKALSTRYDLKLALGLNNICVSVRLLKENTVSSGINSSNIITDNAADSLPEEHINLWVNVCQ